MSLLREKLKLKKILTSLCLATLTMSVLNASADQETRPQGVKVIRISGPISAKSFAKLTLDLTGFRNSDPFPAGLIVLLNSPGGDGDIAMKMGRLLRQHHAHVFVTKQCDSACVFLFMGGVVRAANADTLGVHAGRLTMMAEDGQIIREVDANRSLSNAFQLATYNRDVRLYLEEMGIHHGILDVMLSHRTPQVYTLSAAEMREYQITGFDNNYLSDRIEMLEVYTDDRRFNRVSFFNRTMSVPARCQRSEYADRNFIDCYRRTLTSE